MPQHNRWIDKIVYWWKQLIQVLAKRWQKLVQSLSSKRSRQSSRFKPHPQQAATPIQNLQLTHRVEAFEKAVLSLEATLIKLSQSQPELIQPSCLEDITWLQRVALREIRFYHQGGTQPTEFWRGYDEGKQTRRVFSKQTSEMVYRIKQDYENQTVSAFDFGFLVGWRYARVKAQVSRINLLQTSSNDLDSDELMTF